jgi:hypothetical protein
VALLGFGAFCCVQVSTCQKLYMLYYMPGEPLLAATKVSIAYGGPSQARKQIDAP